MNLDMQFKKAADALQSASTIEQYARTVQVARIKLGTADWRERVRWWLGKGPSEWQLESARLHFEMANWHPWRSEEVRL